MKYEFFLEANEPIPLGDDFYFHPPSLREILQKEKEYESLLSVALFQKEVFQLEEHNVSLFDILKLYAGMEDEFRLKLIAVLKFFTKLDFQIMENQIFVEDEDCNIRFLKEQNWITLSECVAASNFINLEEYRSKFKKRDYINDKAREIAEKIEANKKLVDKFKQKEQSMFATIGAFCAKSHNINITQVWDLNYYQYLTQLKHLLNIESYDISTQAAMAGAKISKIQHWSTPKEKE